MNKALFAEEERARGRPASPRIFGSALVPRLAGSRAGSTPGSSRAIGTAGPTGYTAKAAQDNAIFAAVRRQMEALEDKLSGQIHRVQQQSDRLRDAAFARVDSKMGTVEALQPKLDRRLAELSGNYKGLSDEMQAQIRRLDQMDSRLWEWRHQLEEEVRGKFAESDQSNQKVQSSLRVMQATNEDLVKRHNARLLKLEGVIEDRLGHHDEVEQGLLAIHARVSELEDATLQQHEVVPRAPAPPVQEHHDLGIDRTSLLAIETRLADMCAKVEHLIQESHEVHTRVEAQEERLKSLHTRIETKEDHYRGLHDRVERADWEGRIKDLHQVMQDHGQGKLELSEKYELLGKKLDAREQVHDEACEQIRRIHDHIGTYGGVAAPGDVAAVGGDMVASHEALQIEVKDCFTRVVDSEARIEALANALASLRGDVEFAPRLTQLVDQLKDVAPKVIDQELQIQELLKRVSRLEVGGRLGYLTGSGGGTDVTLSASANTKQSFED